MSIQVLYDKVAAFEAGVETELNCKNGCSRCCYVDLSVFEVEAKNILTWFDSLPDVRKAELRQKWKTPLNSTLNFQNETVPSCVFLRDESCTIYEARPLICRTQGLALKFKEGVQDLLDICPLNEEFLPAMKQKEILNLDLLNLILTQLEAMDSGKAPRERVSLSHLLSLLSPAEVD